MARRGGAHRAGGSRGPGPAPENARPGGAGALAGWFNRPEQPGRAHRVRRWHGVGRGGILGAAHLRNAVRRLPRRFAIRRKARGSRRQRPDVWLRRKRSPRGGQARTPWTGARGTTTIRRRRGRPGDREPGRGRRHRRELRISYQLCDHVENLTLVGSAPWAAPATTLRQRHHRQRWRQQIFGHGGNESLIGGAGNDYMVAGEGDDLLSAATATTS